MKPKSKVPKAPPNPFRWHCQAKQVEVHFAPKWPHSELNLPNKINERAILYSVCLTIRKIIED
jgi:hypothetical protein